MFLPQLDVFSTGRWAAWLRQVVAGALLPSMLGSLCGADAMVEFGTFRHHPDISIRLLAAEPDVVDPVALCFDAGGRMYVVEMRDYPYGKDGARGTVRLLELDQAGGVARSTVFAEDLSFPTSIAPWNGGVYVTAPPQIIYLKDTDGDRRADIRRVVFDGFRLGVTDSNVNGLRWGLDNRIHGGNGGNDGKVFRPEFPSQVVDTDDADFAFDPRNEVLDVTVHTASGFGLVFNEVGDSFSTYNIEHIQQRVFPLRYLRRLPEGMSTYGTIDISDHGPAGRIYPVVDSETRVNHPEQAGHFSAAGGMGMIPEGIFSARLAGSVLVGDVVGNLVHRDRLIENGASLIATRAEEESEAEFLASYDRSFRPVGCEVGPDGALYLIDMQRSVIEHPDYIPAVVREHLDVREGERRGRIYRITPQEAGHRWDFSSLKSLADSELTDRLAHVNVWIRGTAQRLLVERNARGEARRLERLARGGDRAGRLHALWTLAGLRQLRAETLAHGLEDPWFALRRASLQLLEGHPEWQEGLWSRVQALAGDADARVRLQALLLLGEREDPEDAAVLAEAFKANRGQDRWLDLAVLSSLGKHGSEVLRRVLDDADFLTSGAGVEAQSLARLTTAGLLASETSWVELGDKLVSVLQQRALPSGVATAIVRGLNEAAALRRETFRPSDELVAVLKTLSQSDFVSLKYESIRLLASYDFVTATELATVVSWVQGIASDPDALLESRLESLTFFRLLDYSAMSSELWEVFWASERSEIQRELLGVLKEFSETDIAERLLRGWRRLLPALRPAVINVLLRREAYHGLLLTAIEQGDLSLGELNLDLEQRRRLRRWSSDEVTERARKLFGDEEYGHRSVVVAEWMKRLPARGDAEAGRAIYSAHCSACHRLDGEGHEVGPPLTSLRHRSVEDLLSNILDPNMAINPRYSVAVIETNDGEVYSGIVVGQDQHSVTVRMALGIETSIARARIESMAFPPTSLMPSGWETLMGPQELRDLIALLRRP